MTWPEVKQRNPAGKDHGADLQRRHRTARPAGRQRRPHLIGARARREIAVKLAMRSGTGDSFSVNRANAELPGTIGILPARCSRSSTKQVAEQMIANGFRTWC